MFVIASFHFNLLLICLNSKQKSGSGCTVSLPGVYQRLRLVHVEMTLFNEVNSWPVYGIKVNAIGTNILFGFAAIQLFYHDRLLSVLSASILLQDLFAFKLMYDVGVPIPKRATRLRSLLALNLGMTNKLTTRERGTLKRQVNSIGSLAVRVGLFHFLERTSSPKYLDFCVKHIIRLVMAYRRMHC